MNLADALRSDRPVRDRRVLNPVAVNNMIVSRYLFVSAITLAMLPSCKSKDSSAPVPIPSASPSAISAPLASGRAASRHGDILEGKVAETFDVGMYTYLRLETPKGEQWAAVPKTKVAVGDQVTVQQAMPMRKFHSPTLNRDFELIYFGVLPGAAASAPPMTPHPAPAASLPQNIQVPKAKVPNAHTVEEIAKDGSKLAGKPVAIQGMVVKVNTGILDRNWIHIQDGTGTKDAKTNDLLVTSADQARVGEVVLVKGKVATDKDFGSGYSYKVLVEEASITVQK